MAPTFYVEENANSWRVDHLPMSTSESKLEISGPKGKQAVQSSVVRIGPGIWSVLIEHRSYVVELSEQKPHASLRINGVEWKVALSQSQPVGEKAGTKAAKKGEKLCAPIAGKVVKIAASVGQNVEAGQVICVLEAMKMENELRCQSTGVVKEIHVQVGASVETGATLITLAS